MTVTIIYHKKTYTVDFSKPMTISAPISRDGSNPNAYFLPDAVFEPFSVPDFIGSVVLGGPCNCEVIRLAPHGNGTHTECVGHITPERHAIRDAMTSHIGICRLHTIVPEQRNGDWVIERRAIETALQDFHGDCLVVRTLPNEVSKLHKVWSGTNPPYCELGCGTVLRESGIDHLVLDLPSVDREEDAGKLAVHHEFWNYPASPRMHATITELVYVPNSIADGEYLIQFSLLALDSDASPSQIHLYELSAE